MGFELWHPQLTPTPTNDSPKPALGALSGVRRRASSGPSGGGHRPGPRKRMEKAWERQVGIPPQTTRIIHEETLAGASSLSELALRPKLAKRRPPCGRT